MSSESVSLRQYLLGILSEPETETIDLPIIEDEIYSAEVLLAESNLIEDYLEGALSDAESRLFESNFLTSPERRDQFQEICRIRRHVRHWTEREKAGEWNIGPFGRFANLLKRQLRPMMAGAAMVTAILLIAFAWLSFNESASSLEKEYAELNKRDLSNPGELTGFSVISLSPGSFRDVNSVVTHDTGQLTNTVLLRLALPAGSEKISGFNAKISRGPSLIFSLDDLRRNNPNAYETRFLAPKSILETGRYQIRLENAANGELVGIYVISIE